MCLEQDGKDYPLAEAVVGIKYPPLHPWCRSTTIPYFEDLGGERIAKDADGTRYYVPGDMTYEEWKEFVLDNESNRRIMDIGGHGKHVNTDGLRNEQPLTLQQQKMVADYAVSLGMPRENIYYLPNSLTGYNPTWDILVIGTDVFPLNERVSNPNSNVSYKGAIAHEIIGHRMADLQGVAHPDQLFEEVQASVRAARFAPGLSRLERSDLLRDAIGRLHIRGLRLRDIRGELFIDEE